MTIAPDPRSSRGMIDALLTTVDAGDAIILSRRAADLSKLYGRVHRAAKRYGVLDSYRLCFRARAEGVVAWMERRTPRAKGDRP